MRFDDEIQMPSASEIDSSVNFILDSALPGKESAAAHSGLFGRSSLRLRDIIFGIEDCIAIVFTVFIVVMLAFSQMSAKGFPFIPLQFILAPSLFAGLMYLSMWKDLMNKSVEWKISCRINYKLMTVYRMFLFGGVSLLSNLGFNYLLWTATGENYSFLWILCFSFASLFLFGFIALILLNRNVRYGLPALFILWTGIGCSMFLVKDIMALTVKIPVYAMLLILVLSGAGLIFQIRKYLASPMKGDVINAYN